MMKSIVSYFLILGQLLSVTPAKAALSEADRALVDQFKVQLKNPGFESGSSFWTSSGGATAASNSTAKGTGALGYDWDSNGAGQTLTSSLVTIPAGLQGKNGIISCTIKTVSGTATHTLGVWDGTTLSSAQTITSSTTSFADTKINFIFPSSGSIAIRATSVNANEPEVYVDDCKISLADNIGTVAQARVIGGSVTTGCALSWFTTSSSFASLGTQTGCSYAVFGDVTAPSTNLAAIKVPSMPAGEYLLTYDGRFGTPNTGVNPCQFEVYDGTNEWRERPSSDGTGTSNYFMGSTFTSSYKYSTPQSNLTLEIRAKNVNATGNACTVSGVNAYPGVFKLYYYPSSSQQAVSSAQADYDWTSYTPTFTGFGTVASSECQHSRVASNLLLRCKFTSGISTAIEARISLPSGLISADTTKIPTIQHAGMASFSVAGADVKQILIEPSVSYVTVSVQGASNAGLTKINGNAFISSGQSMSFSATIPIQGWSSSQRAPTLVGSVTSSSSSAIALGSVSIGGSGGTLVTPTACTSTPCTVYYADGFTSVTRSSTGVYVFNRDSRWSQQPTCSIGIPNFSGSNYGCGCVRSASTSSSFTMTCGCSTVATDLAIELNCFGPR